MTVDRPGDPLRTEFLGGSANIRAQCSGTEPHASHTWIRDEPRPEHAIRDVATVVWCEGRQDRPSSAKHLNTILDQANNAPPATPAQRARMHVVLADQRETLKVLTEQHRKMAAATASEDGAFAGCGMTTATLQALDLSARQLELLVAVAVMMLAEHDD